MSWVQQKFYLEMVEVTRTSNIIREWLTTSFCLSKMHVIYCNVGTDRKRDNSSSILLAICCDKCSFHCIEISSFHFSQDQILFKVWKFRKVEVWKMYEHHWNSGILHDTRVNMLDIKCLYNYFDADTIFLQLSCAQLAVCGPIYRKKK